MKSRASTSPHRSAACRDRGVRSSYPNFMVVGRAVPGWKAAPVVIYDDEERVVLAQRLYGLEAAAEATANMTGLGDVPGLELAGIIEGAEWLGARLHKRLTMTVASNRTGETQWFDATVSYVHDPAVTGERYEVVVERVAGRSPPYWAT